MRGETFLNGKSKQISPERQRSEMQSGMTKIRKKQLGKLELISYAVAHQPEKYCRKKIGKERRPSATPSLIPNNAIFDAPTE